MAAGQGFKTFATGDILTAADLNGYLMSQTVMVFADSTARAAAITSPQQGMLTFLKGTNATEYYNGSAWVAVAGSSLTSPLTTKGDVWGYSTTNARVPVGTNGQVLTADSTQSTGVAWATPSSGGGMTLLDTLTLSGSSVTSTTFSSAYPKITIYIKGAYCGTNQQMNLRLNGDTSNNYSWTFVNDGSLAATSTATNFARIGNIGTSASVLNQSYQIVTIMRPLDTDKVFITTAAQYIEGSVQNFDCTGVYDNSAAITSATLYIGTGSFSGGTAYIYGEK